MLKRMLATADRRQWLLPMVASIFTASQRKQAYGMIGVLCFFSAVEVVGLSSVLPFIAALASPAAMRARLGLDPWLASLGVLSDRSFQLTIALLVVIVFTLKNVAIGIGEYLRYRWSYRLAADLSERLLQHYLNQDYRYFLDVNSQNLLKNVANETWIVISGVVLPLLTIASEVLVGLMLYAVLLWVNFWLTLIASVTVAGCGALVYAAVNRSTHKLGEERERLIQLVYQDVGSALTGIKVIKSLDAERYFVRRVAKNLDVYARGSGFHNTMGAVPRLALELIGVVAIVLTMMVMLFVQSLTIVEMLPILTLYGIALYRFMPSVNRIITSRLSIQFSRRALEVIAADMRRSGTLRDRVSQRTASPIPFTRSIALRDVSFSYSGSALEKTVTRLNLEILKGQTVGIVGASGSGKTTAIDMLLGLLVPDEGSVVVDGRRLTRDDLDAWHALVGYIPQDNFLYDDTLLRNVAFGVPDERIDRQRAWDAVRAAHLQEFVESLPAGLETPVGDRGIRLSGGQRQRVGIARAVYRDPEVLVFDEATSSLDAVTEQEIGKAIEWLGGVKTIVIVAHRLTTVRHCDRIYLIDRGEILAFGTYDELLVHSPEFQRLAVGTV